MALHAKAKAEAGYRFYALYDKISREDILVHAYAQCRSNKGAPGVDDQDFADIEAYGVERWLAELALALREETYRPEPIRRVYIDQLPGDAHPAARFAHRAFKNVTHAQFLTDLLHVDRLPFVSEAGIARDDDEPPDTAERGDDLFDHAVGEVFLFRVAAHIGKGQHRNRRFVGQRERCRLRCGRHRTSRDPVGPYWPRNVLERLLAHILEGEVELAGRVFLHAR